MKKIRTLVAIYGGGHAGAMLAKKLGRNHKILLVDSNSFFEVSSSIPRSLVDAQFAQKAVIPFKQAIPEAQFVHGKLLDMKPSGLATVQLFNDQNNNEPQMVQIESATAVLATGSRYKTSVTRSSTERTSEERHRFYAQFEDKVSKAKTVVVAGAGPIGVEFSAEIAEKYGKDKQVILICPEDRVLATTTAAASRVAAKFLDDRGVIIKYDCKVLKEDGRNVFLCNGETITCDLMVWASGGTPNTSYLDKSWPQILTPKREIKVQESLLVEGSDNIFAMGDIAALNEPKLAWFCNGQVQIIAHNIKQILDRKRANDEGLPIPNTSLKKYKAHPNDPRMAVTLGSEHGVLQIPYFGTISWSWMARMAKSRNMFVPKFRRAFGLD